MITKEKKGFNVVFYQTANGKQPVREFIKSLEKGNQREIGADIRVVQNSFPIGLPLVRKIKSGLWEIRSMIKDGISRIFFTFRNEKMILLHAIVKKTQKTPLEDIEVATKRLQEFIKLQE